MVNAYSPVSKLLYAYWLLLIFCCLGCDSDPRNFLQVNVQTMTWPILINKSINPALKIKIVKGKEEIDRLEQITFQIAGIETGTAALFRCDGDDFCMDDEIMKVEFEQGKIQFSLDYQLVKDTIDVWLGLNLEDALDLDEQLSISCERIIMQGREINFEKTGPEHLRLGYALRKHSEDGVDTYRIPGMVTTREGSLIAVYDVRYNGPVDLQADVDVGMSRSTDGGQKWEPMQIIMDMKEWGGLPDTANGIGDPSILYDHMTHTIWVAAIWAHGHPGERNWYASGQGLKPSETSQLMLTKSEDDGLTWSAPINLTGKLKDPTWHLLLQGPGKGITTSTGVLVFPAQYKDAEQVPHSTILYSLDQGKTWKLGTGAKSHTTESQVVELADGSLMLNMRDDRGRPPLGKKGDGYRSVAVTGDFGQTWEPHVTDRNTLIEPVCNAALIKHHYQDHDYLIFVNPADQYQRRAMTIKVSEDGGLSWPEKFHTLIDAGSGRGYPTVTAINENILGVLYEGSQADLVFQRIKFSELLE